MEDKLKVGDKIAYIDNNHGSLSYTFDEVERITPMHTQAVTKKGRRIKREGFDMSGQTRFFEVDSHKLWQRVTPEIIAEAKAEMRLREVRNWFRLRSFTDAEKLEIFERYGGQDLKAE